MSYLPLNGGTGRTVLISLLLVVAWAAIPARPTLAANNTGPVGTTHTVNPPCDPFVRPRTRSIDGLPVAAHGPHGMGSAFNPTEAQPNNGCIQSSGCDYTRVQPSFYQGRCVCVDVCKSTCSALGTKQADMADQYWSLEGMLGGVIEAPYTYYVGMPQAWQTNTR